MKSNIIVVTMVGSMLTLASSVSHAVPLVTSLIENGTGLNANPAIVTSASNPSGPAGDSQSAALADEAFALVTRSTEWTAVRTNDGTGLVTTSTAAGTTLRPFPSYLVGLEYIQIANENRTVADYSLDINLSASVRAYIFLDNRSDGAGDNEKTNTTDPITATGPLSWIATDGWTRVNTGFMPNGQADYIGTDDSTSAAVTAATRTHANANLVAGSGNGLNTFEAIFSKVFGGGAHIGLTKAMGHADVSMYGVAFAPLGQPLVLGDTNGNNIGGEYPADFDPIRDNFRKSPRTRLQGDLTGNGLVDFADFREWKAAALGSGASLEGLDLSFLGTVPEPGSGLLALLAGTVIVAVSSRRRGSAASKTKG